MNARDSLSHPLRRQILRILIETKAPLSAGEIVSTALPGCAISVVSYHAQVLEAAGKISGADDVPADDPARRYRVSIDDDPETTALLDATRTEDCADS